ncbi:hypothetical protein F4779DRAFT_639293 [Xylariaceae sp. FL0662B]|nr:hypothetical protein F4779DRAFT_639293 [Xylariaceae sp. FL0662B]
MTRVATLLLAYIGVVAGSVQYCHHEVPQNPFTFCAAVNTHLNTTTSALDWAITFGYQRTRDAGWAALGIGSSMYGALMFITYTKEKSTKDLIISVRRGMGYFEPKLATPSPEIDTISLSLNQSGWFETSFLCYDCSAWSLINDESNEQPWIWAVNVNQVFSDVSEDSQVHKHGYYGYFKLDMPAAVLIDSGKTMPKLDPSAPNTAAAKDGKEYDEPTADTGDTGWSSSSNLFALHGGLFALSIMVLYPFGVLALRKKSETSFKNHIYFQLTASFTSIVSICLVLYAISNGSQIHLLGSFHGLLGSAIAILILLQIVLGYIHHRAFLAATPIPKVTLSHIWVGRLIIAAGCLNVLLGIRLAGASILVFIFALTLTGINIALLVAFTWAQTSIHAPKIAESITEDEDSRPFIEMSEHQIRDESSD